MVDRIIHRGSRQARDLMLNALVSAYRSGLEVEDPDYALAKDPVIWDKVQRDPIIKHAFEARLHSVAGIEPTVHPGPRQPTPADEAMVVVMERLLGELNEWESSRKQLAKAVPCGTSWQFIRTRRKLMDIGGVRQWWLVPVALETIPKQRIRIQSRWNGQQGEVGARIETWPEVYDLASMRWVRFPSTAPLVHLVYDDDETRLGYGRGILEAIYFFYYAKGIVLREGLQGLKKWAQGMVVGKVAGTGKSMLSNETTRNDLLDVINKMRAENAIVVDGEDEVSVVWPSGEGHKQVMEWFSYLDSGITRVILGSVLPTGGGEDTGSNARARVEQESTESLLGYDRRILCSAYRRDMLGMLVRHNRPQLARLGLEGAALPRLLSRAVPVDDPNEIADQVVKLGQAGVPLVLSEVYHRAGWTQPGEADDVLDPPMLGGDAFGLAGSVVGEAASKPDAPRSEEDGGTRGSQSVDTGRKRDRVEA